MGYFEKKCFASRRQETRRSSPASEITPPQIYAMSILFFSFIWHRESSWIYETGVWASNDFLRRKKIRSLVRPARFHAASRLIKNFLSLFE